MCPLDCLGPLPIILLRKRKRQKFREQGKRQLARGSRCQLFLSPGGMGMINDVILEGLVVRTWTMAGDCFYRIVSFRDPGLPPKFGQRGPLD